MTETITIFNQKGGVGKTTTAVTLAHGLAREGYTAVIIDLDGQGHVAEQLGIPKRPNLYGLMFGGLGAKAVTETGRIRLWAVTTDRTTARIQSEIQAATLREYTLLRALQTIEGFDYIIIDTPPSPGVLQINALCACGYFLIPVLCDYLAGPSAALGTAASLAKMGATEARFLGILPTQWARTTKHTAETLAALGAKFGDLLWAPIPVDTKIREAAAHQKTIWEYCPLGRSVVGTFNGKGYVGGYNRALDRLLEDTGK